MEKEIVFFESGDKSVSLKVPLQNETVWLSAHLMSELFGRDEKTIYKHIKNVFLEGEVDEKSNSQNLRLPNSDKPVAFYSLDVIISVGYRVKSQRGVEFRKWANSVLRQYIMNGYAANTHRLEELNQTLQIIKRIEKNVVNLEKSQILEVIEKYTTALNLLDDYDHQCVTKPSGNDSVYVLEYEECRKLIDSMRFSSESDLFGNEKDQSFKGSLGAVYQTFGGKDVYPSIQEKAANLLYFVVKNHSFSDGNKRIAAAVFLYFLDKNNWLFIEDKKRIEDNTLVALTIMIAESRPEEKEIMINLVMNFLV